MDLSSHHKLSVSLPNSFVNGQDGYFAGSHSNEENQRTMAVRNATFKDGEMSLDDDNGRYGEEEDISADTTDPDGMSRSNKQGKVDEINAPVLPIGRRNRYVQSSFEIHN